MNYQKHYDLLIQRAQSRGRPDGYTERHHVVPRCMGGADDISNLVRLTAEEHFVAHQLLAKEHPKNYKLALAAVRMAADTNGGRRSNKLYGWLRRKFASNYSGEAHPLFGKVGNRLGVPHTPEVRAKLSASHKGKPQPKGVMSSQYGKPGYWAGKSGAAHPQHGLKRTPEQVANWKSSYLSKPRKGLRIWMTKDGGNKKIDAMLQSEFELDGWKRGYVRSPEQARKQGASLSAYYAKRGKAK